MDQPAGYRQYSSTQKKKESCAVSMEERPRRPNHDSEGSDQEIRQPEPPAHEREYLRENEPHARIRDRLALMVRQRSPGVCESSSLIRSGSVSGVRDLLPSSALAERGRVGVLESQGSAWELEDTAALAGVTVVRQPDLFFVAPGGQSG